MVYLDNAANAPVFPEVLEAMLPWLRPDHVGNPGSLHTQGVKAREAVENARRQVAKMIGADPSEVFFTSGGTESNNAWLQNFGGDLILTTALEHDSVLEPMSAHCHRHYIKVHKDGSVDLNDLERFLSDAHTAESNYLKEAQTVYEAYDKKLRELKKQSRMTVEEMKLRGNMKDLLGDLDELRRDSATDKLLGSVRDGAEDLRKEVDGAIVVHASRTTTKMSMAEKNAAKAQSDAYLQSLATKYNGKPAIQAPRSGVTFDAPKSKVKEERK